MLFRSNLPENSSIDAPDDLVVRVQETGKGEELKLEDGSHISSYKHGSLDGTSVWRAEVPRSGTYAVVASVGPGAPYADKAITFGPDADMGAILLRGAILIVVGLAIAGILWQVANRIRTPPPPAASSSEPTPPAGGFEAKF